MFTLMVSFDAGVRYEPFMSSENCEELIERTKPRKDSKDPWDDISWTRWYIEKNGEAVEKIMCPIHRGIIDTIKKLNKLNKEE